MNSLSLLFEITSHKSFYEQTLPKAFICAIKGFVLIQASNGIFTSNNLVFILLGLQRKIFVLHNISNTFHDGLFISFNFFILLMSVQCHHFILDMFLQKILEMCSIVFPPMITLEKSYVIKSVCVCMTNHFLKRIQNT
jgi:hypothetical protein